MNFLAHYRKIKHLKQFEVAKMLNISDVMISKFETEKVMPTNEQIVKLSEIYQVSVKKLLPDLFGGDKNE